MTENHDDRPLLLKIIDSQYACTVRTLELIENIFSRLRIRLDSYIHYSLNLYDIVWLEIKLDVWAIHMVILTINLWLYYIYHS